MITEHICRLQDCVSSLHKMQVDSTEYAYLKALTLFSSGRFTVIISCYYKNYSIHFIISSNIFTYIYIYLICFYNNLDNILTDVWRKKVEVLQEAAWCELQQRVGPDRLPRLLLKLAPLRSINPRVLEDLFFAGLIGRVSVASVVPYILGMQDCKADNDAQMV